VGVGSRPKYASSLPQLNWSSVGPDVQHGGLAYDVMSGTVSNMTKHAKRMSDVLFRFITF